MEKIKTYSFTHFYHHKFLLNNRYDFLNKIYLHLVIFSTKYFGIFCESDFIAYLKRKYKKIIFVGDKGHQVVN